MIIKTLFSMANSLDFILWFMGITTEIFKRVWPLILGLSILQTLGTKNDRAKIHSSYK